MAVRPTRPALGARYDRRRDEIVAGAAREFARRGYGGTTMAELAGSLGLATGALYHYFAAKEELLRAICDELMEPLLSAARELAAHEPDPAVRLRALVRLWVAHVCEHRDHMLTFQQERHLIESGERWRPVRASRKAFERLAGEVLAEALVAGRTGEPYVRSQGRAGGGLGLLALLGMVNHTAQWYRPRGRLTPEQIADGYVELLLGRR